MGFASTKNTSKIVCVYKDRAAYVYALGPTSCSWRQIQAVSPGDLSTMNTCAYGDMHRLVWRGRHRDFGGGGRSHIISFDFKKEEFCSSPNPALNEASSDYLGYTEYFLLNMKGSMTIADISSRKYVEIYVMKNYGKKEWSLDCKIQLSIFVGRPKGMFKFGTCGEWEKGIFFVQENESWDGEWERRYVYYILDLQQASVKPKEKLWSRYNSTFSCTGSLIPLKCYGDLVQPSTKTNVLRFD